VKNFIRKPSPFFLSQYFVLNFTCHNLGSVKPTADGRCCTHKSYLLDVPTHSNPFNQLDDNRDQASGQSVKNGPAGMVPAAIYRCNIHVSVFVIHHTTLQARTSLLLWQQWPSYWRQDDRAFMTIKTLPEKYSMIVVSILHGMPSWSVYP